MKNPFVQLTTSSTLKNTVTNVAHRNLITFIRYTLLPLVLMLSVIAHAEQVLHVYETYWPADKIAPVVQDILGPGDTISVYKNKLIIRTERANHEEIQKVLDEVDRPPHNLLVSLRRSNQNQVTSRGVNVSPEYAEMRDGVRIQRGDDDNNVVVYRGSSTDRRVEMRVLPRQSISTEHDSSVHQVRVLEGEEGFISLGEEMPVQEQVVTMNGVNNVNHYKPVTSGIYVTPKLQKDKVFLEINSRSQRVKGNNTQANIEVSSINTTVTAPLGLWTPLGGVDQSARENSSGITYSTRQKGQQDLGYEIKVDVIE